METPTKRPEWVNAHRKAKPIDTDLWAGYEEAIAILTGERVIDEDDAPALCIVPWHELEGVEPTLSYGDFLEAERDWMLDYASDEPLGDIGAGELRYLAAIADELDVWFEHNKPNPNRVRVAG